MRELWQRSHFCVVSNEVDSILVTKISSWMRVCIVCSVVITEIHTIGSARKALLIRFRWYSNFVLNTNNNKRYAGKRCKNLRLLSEFVLKTVVLLIYTLPVRFTLKILKNDLAWVMWLIKSDRTFMLFVRCQ